MSQLPEMGNWAREWEWRHAPEARGGFGGFWKSQLVESSSASGEDGWLSLARRNQASGLCGGCHTRGGGRWKSQNRKNVYLSPYVEKTFKLKGNKSFVPELRSRKCFSCFEIPMFYVLSLWTFDVRFTHSHIMAMVQFFSLRIITWSYIYWQMIIIIAWKKDWLRHGITQQRLTCRQTTQPNKIIKLKIPKENVN